MTDWLSLRKRLIDCVGPEGITENFEGILTADLPVCALVQPANVEQLCRVVQIAFAADCPIYPIGGRTFLRYGFPGRRKGIGLSTLLLDRVIDYPSNDMTVTVQAGIRIAKLQTILGDKGQRLPIDIPRAIDSTLGGGIACNMNGPRRYAYGTFRDYVIGVGVVDAKGTLTKAGGRVVKNVAGYDLCKLYTGSLGTLGIIVQVTLKLRPLAEANAILWLQFERLDQVRIALDRLSSSDTRPVAIEVLNSAAAERMAGQLGRSFPFRPWVLLVGFEDRAEAIVWQRTRLLAELQELEPWNGWIEGEDSIRLWNLLVDFQSAEFGPVAFKASFPSSATADFLDAVQRQSEDWAVVIHAGNGIAHGQMVVWADQAAVDVGLEKLRKLSVKLHGNLVITRCPTEWKPGLPIWGEPRLDKMLMESLKKKLDPTSILNPGRFIGSV